MAFSDSDFPPPPVTQPTLPPPAMDDEDDTVRVDAITGSPARLEKLRAWAKRRDAQFGAATVIAIAMVGGYTGFSPKGPEVGHATTNEAHITLSRPDDLMTRIDGVMAALTPATLDQPCSDLNARIPLVLYSSVEDRATNKPLTGESVLFATAMPLTALDQETAKSQRIAILRTLTLKEPQASVGHPTAGRYEGDLVVLDTSTGARLCHTRVVAWSSAIADERSISERVLRDDFTSRVRTAASEAGARLRVNLEL